MYDQVTACYGPTIRRLTLYILRFVVVVVVVDDDVFVVCGGDSGGPG